MWEGANCAEGGKVGVTIVLMIAYLIYIYIVTLRTRETQSEYTGFFFAFTEYTKNFWVCFLN
jgi:hypothetical protein